MYMFCRLAKRGDAAAGRQGHHNQQIIIFDGYRGKRLGLEAEDSSPSNAKVRNKWSCPSVPPYHT